VVRCSIERDAVEPQSFQLQIIIILCVKVALRNDFFIPVHLRFWEKLVFKNM